MGLFRSIVLLLHFLLIFSSPFANAEQVTIPSQPLAVIDQTNTLTAAEIQQLSDQILTFEKAKGSQMSVLIVPNTGEETIEQYSMRVVEKWKLGRKGVDDGVLLLVAKDQRELRIEVGYGLEGSLTDALANRIINEVIVPKFKAEEFAQGIQSGVTQMIQVIDGEPLPDTTKVGLMIEAQPYWVKIAVLAMILSKTLGTLLKRITKQPKLAAIITGIAAFSGYIVFWGWHIIPAIVTALICGVLTMVTRGNGSTSRHGSSRSSSRSSSSRSGGGGGFGGGGSSGRW